MRRQSWRSGFHDAAGAGGECGHDCAGGGGRVGHGQRSEHCRRGSELLGLDAGQAAVVADLLAATANASAVDVTDLGDSLVNGAVASSAGCRSRKLRRCWV